MNLKLLVIGIGSVGSWICFNSVLKHIHDPFLDQLIIIDHDKLSISNLPYITINSKKYKDTYKCTVLKNILNNLGYDNIVQDCRKYYHGIYPNTSELFIIDCRDTRNVFPYTKLKINLDDCYAFVEINPTPIDKYSHTTEYYIKNNKFYSNVISSIITSEYINEQTFLDNMKRKIIYNLKYRTSPLVSEMN